MPVRSIAPRTMTALLLSLAPVSAFAADAAVQGITLPNESPDQWRVSKLIGVPIYGPDNKRVGKIADMLADKDGRSQDIIVGVGGFLGIGEKDVAIPYAAVNFSNEPIAPPPETVPANNMATPAATMTPDAGTGGTPANGGALATPGLGAPADPLSPNAGAVAPVPSTAYPDHGTIAFTADQLKNAPAFHFAK